MRPYQYKRDRPTFTTAHNFFKEGGFTTDPQLHTLRGKERRAQIDAVIKELLAISKREFPRTAILEYAILKSHLICEHALTEYIRCFSATFVEKKDLRFTFSNKLEIAYLLGFGANDPIILPTVERLNKIRNQAAHSFVIDRTALDEMLRVNSEDYESYESKDDKQRIRHLRYICYYICAYVGGHIEAAFAMIGADQTGWESSTI